MRPYTFPASFPLGSGTVPNQVPKGYHFELREIRVIGGELDETQMTINSAAKSLEFFPVPVPADLLCSHGQTVVSVIKKQVLFSDADVIITTVSGAVNPVRVALCGVLIGGKR